MILRPPSLPPRVATPATDGWPKVRPDRAFGKSAFSVLRDTGHRPPLRSSQCTPHRHPLQNQAVRKTYFNSGSCNMFCFFIILAVLTGTLSTSLTGMEVEIPAPMAKILHDGSNLDGVRRSRIVLDLAGNESESFQLVLPPSPGSPPRQVRVAVAAFPVDGIAVDVFRVGYVRTGNPSYAVSRVGLWPDPLFATEEITLTPERCSVLFFNVSVRGEVPAGVYRSTVRLTAEDGERKDIPLQVRVRDFVLPFPGTLKVPVGLYPDPIAAFYRNAIGTAEPFSDEEWRQWARLLARNRMTPKELGTVYMRSLPDRPLVPDPTVVRENVQTLAPLVVPESFHFFRLPSAVTMRKRMDNGLTGPALVTGMQPEAIAAAWRDADLPPNRLLYGCDEPKVGDQELLLQLRQTYLKVKQAVPGVRILQTVSGAAPILAGAVDIWCPKISGAFHPFFQERRKAGDELWIYTCCSPIPPAANLFVDRPAIEHRILPWMAAKVGATGFLYWSSAWFKGVPEKEWPEDGDWDLSRHEFYWSVWIHTNGDGILLYPGKNRNPHPSIRLFALRDGLEDYEYLALLKHYLKAVEALPVYHTPAGAALVKAARDLTTVPDEIVTDAVTYTRSPGQLLERRRRIADMIEQLKHILEKQDFKRWGKRDA